MRIEKINEHQIRCTLNHKDLKDRELRISELAYGTDKAKALFRDMMQQASYELGFETEDIPLMVEAIPMFPDTLVLVITKIDDPEELDTRFSQFTEDLDELYAAEAMDEDAYEDNANWIQDNTSSDDVSYDEDWLGNIGTKPKYNDALPFPNTSTTPKETDFISLPEALGMEPRPKTTAQPKMQADIIRIYRFPILDQVIALGEHLQQNYHGQNTLYKNEKTGEYYLLLHRNTHTPEAFNKICNVISEYGSSVRNTYSSPAYYEEHMPVVIQDNALQVLGALD